MKRMSELEAESRRRFIENCTDEQFLFLYTTRLARLATFKKLKAPERIVRNELLLVDEIVAESKFRPFSRAELYVAVNSELKKKRYQRHAS